ncbi:hypothetical protein ACFLXL_02705, partial [Chloroflexota bacterium]
VFVGARIAGADMMRTSIYTTLIGLPLWIIPFSIFRNNLILGVGTPFGTLAIETAILFAGAYIFVLGSMGYFNRHLKTFERVLLIVIGVMIVQPIEPLYSKIFLGIGILVLVFWLLSSRLMKSKAVEQTSSE